MKMLQYSVYSTIAAFHQGRFPGGQALVFEADNQGVGLPMANSRFRTFSQAQYDNIFRRLAGGQIPRMATLAEGGNPSIVPVRIVNVTFID
jgi:basic membrane protein A